MLGSVERERWVICEKEGKEKMTRNSCVLIYICRERKRRGKKSDNFKIKWKCNKV